MDTEVIAIREKIMKGEIDINNQSSFFHHLIGALLAKLNSVVKIRGEVVPHYILNTGDDTMYLMNKGYDKSLEPIYQTNENNITSVVPRAIFKMDDISIQKDQLTSPYSRGKFDLIYGDKVIGFDAEFRRMPLLINTTVTYLTDTFSDIMELSQYFISNLAFLIPFKFEYMGQVIFCNVSLPESLNREIKMDIGGDYAESKLRTMELQLEVLTNMPVYKPQTVIENSCRILSMKIERSMYNAKTLTELGLNDYPIEELIEKGDMPNIPSKTSDVEDDTLAHPVKRTQNADDASYKKVKDSDIDKMFEGGTNG